MIIIIITLPPPTKGFHWTPFENLQLKTMKLRNGEPSSRHAPSLVKRRDHSPVAHRSIYSLPGRQRAAKRRWAVLVSAPSNFQCKKEDTVRDSTHTKWFFKPSKYGQPGWTRCGDFIFILIFILIFIIDSASRNLCDFSTPTWGTGCWD